MCVCTYINCVCWCLSSPYLSSAMPGCAACALVTGAPSACVRTSSTLSCCRRSGPNSTLWYSEGPLYLLHSFHLPIHFFLPFFLPFFAKFSSFCSISFSEIRIKVTFISKTFYLLLSPSCFLHHFLPFHSFLLISCCQSPFELIFSYEKPL